MGITLEFDNSFKKKIAKEADAEWERLEKETKNMTPEQIAERRAEYQREIAELRKFVADNDPEGRFAAMDRSMHDPSNPLYGTYSHNGYVDEEDEEYEHEMDTDEFLTFVEYRQHIYKEGMSVEDALEVCGAKKVTEVAVIFGDEDEELLHDKEAVIAKYGEEIEDIFTEEDKEEARQFIKELEEKGMTIKEFWTPKEDAELTEQEERWFLITDLLNYIEFDGEDGMPEEKEDDFLAVYEALSEKEKTIVSMRIEGKTLREVGEAVEMSHETVRKTEQKIISALLEKC